MAPARIWVPQPASRAYGERGQNPQSVRDAMVRSYGETTVQQCELAIILDVFILTGMMNPNEFMEVMRLRLDKVDQQRRAAAGLEEDRG